MATLLADPPAPPGGSAPTAPSPDGAPPALAAPASLQRICANCSAPMHRAQDWCFQCGAGAQGSLTTPTPGWRSGAAILGAVAVLAIGAAAAAYAALNKSASPAHATRTVFAQAATPPATTPPTTTPVAPATPSPAAPAGGATAKPLFPLTKPPKIPLAQVTPKPSHVTIPPVAAVGSPGAPSAAVTNTPASEGAHAGAGASEGATESQSEAILLDTNAASTYNPYGYPASNFGDPALAIDGEAATAWTAQVEPTVAPKMAEGVAIDLKTGQRLSALQLTTTTPGMTVQVYGANDQLPDSITAPAWVQLSPAFVEKKKRLRIKLRDSTKPFEFVALWISRAPAASVGTPQSPGHVSVNEIELFPAGK